ncbi:MAG: TOBE domain-containing protein, partial [Planctomycetes bacterium]|nr:TOBE domain-containing protein [Planctomycetota bacterium]
VAMGRAIVREPAVFLFDEPLSNLDAKMRVEMRKEILQLHRRINTTMVYVTHDQIEAMTLGDRICVMNVGVIEQVGKPTVIFDHPATLFVARFIGTPPMNIFDGTVREEGGQVFFDGGCLRCPLDAVKAKMVQGQIGKPSHLGIRPRAFHLARPDETAPCKFKGTVEVCEMLGEEVLTHVVSDNHKYIVSLDPHDAQNIEGKEITVVPDLELAHVFSAETGKNLTLPDEVRQTTLPGCAAV